MNRELATQGFRRDFERAVRGAAADLRERADRLEELGANTQHLDFYDLLHLIQSLEDTANGGRRLDLSNALRILAHHLHEITWQAEQPTDS